MSTSGAVPLPDPWTRPAAAECLRCGYSLDGMTPPAPCPECGEPYFASHFTMYGVPTLGTTFRAWQVILIVCVVIAGPFILQAAFVTGLLAGMAMGVSLLLVFIAIGITSWNITRRRSAGACRMVIHGGSMTLVPLQHVLLADGAVQTTIPLLRVRSIRIRRAGPYWITLQMDDTSGKRLFKAGIRCPVASEPLVRQALEDAVRAARSVTPPSPSLTQTPDSAALDRQSER